MPSRSRAGDLQVPRALSANRRLVLYIRSRDVMLSLSPPQDISTLNVLSGTTLPSPRGAQADVSLATAMMPRCWRGSRPNRSSDWRWRRGPAGMPSSKVFPSSVARRTKRCPISVSYRFLDDEGRLGPGKVTPARTHCAGGLDLAAGRSMKMSYKRAGFGLRHQPEPEEPLDRPDRRPLGWRRGADRPRGRVDPSLSCHRTQGIVGHRRSSEGAAADFRKGRRP